ncbi:MAG: gluconate 5-dehydrogenase [Paracoccaceae bacterium]|jgi:gluconate 5-dehydrogenase
MITDMDKALINTPALGGWVKARTPKRRQGLPKGLAGAAIHLA